MENEGEIVRSSRGNNDSAQTLTEVTIREWIMVLILWFLNLINYMDRFTIAGMLEDIQSYFKIQNDKGGLLQTGFIFSYMIFAPVFGYLGDRYNRKNILAISVLFWSLATLVGSFMQNYWLFLLFRFFVGIGEASYSTVAPTIISDVFALDVRSYMLALFYFAIPIGCGSGYIVGSEMAKLFGAWQWGLRLTPILGVFGAILSFFVLKNPERGASDGNIHISTTPWTKDLKNLLRNRSFLLTTAAATCVSFVAGVLTWWGPKYLKLGFDLQSGVSKNIKERSTFIFGVITMIAGMIGLILGCCISQKLRPKFAGVDPLVCGVGLFLSIPTLIGATYYAGHSVTLCYLCLFLGEVTLSLNWSIVSDMLLYVVLPTRRSIAEGVHLLVLHALGDAESPYLIGVLSEVFLSRLNEESKSEWNEFKALQYGLFLTCIVEILGAFFFATCTFYIQTDKQKVDREMQQTN